MIINSVKTKADCYVNQAKALIVNNCIKSSTKMSINQITF